MVANRKSVTNGQTIVKHFVPKSIIRKCHLTFSNLSLLLQNINGYYCIETRNDFKSRWTFHWTFNLYWSHVIFLSLSLSLFVDLTVCGAITQLLILWKFIANRCNEFTYFFILLCLHSSARCRRRNDLMQKVNWFLCSAVLWHREKKKCTKICGNSIALYIGMSCNFKTNCILCTI